MISKYLRYSLLLLFTVLITFSGFAYSLKDTEVRKVVIGVKLAPPFVEKGINGYSGLSIDSWNLVNTTLNWEYEYKEYKTLVELLEAIDRKEVDFSINPITVTANRLDKYEFTQPYFISNTAIAQKKEDSLWNIIVNIWSWRFISAVALLAGIVFLFGFLVWLFEKGKNEEFNGSRKWSGIWQGFWWSAVTMTTVGYGDKSPRTTGGRVVGLIWMFMAVVIISSLTAGIASALTVQNLSKTIKSVEDLARFKIATIKGSSSEEFLDTYNLEYQTVDSVEQGLEEIKNEQVQLFVYDEPLMRYSIEKGNMIEDILILQKVLRKDYFAYCFPAESELVNRINPILMNSLKDMKWMNRVKRYNLR